MKAIIEIDIWEIIIDEKEYYYRFNYILSVNWNKQELVYEHDFSGQTWDELKLKLENWFAMECVVEYLYSNSYIICSQSDNQSK